MEQVWFITGCSRGLGRAITEEALANGFKVAATARDPGQLWALKEKYGSQVETIALNVTDARAVDTAIARAIAVFGSIDVVVNNAGYGNVSPVEDLRLDDLHAQMETNFFGVVHVTKAVLPHMRLRGEGRILQISSIGARLGTPGIAAYQAAKWAVEGFSEALSKEVAPLGIEITIVEPGGFRTDWAGSSMTVGSIRQEYRPTVGVVADYLRQNSGKQPGDPSRAAKVILNLATIQKPPLRLLLGSDAVDLAEKTSRERIREDEEWRSLSISTDFECEPVEIAYPWQNQETLTERAR
ncbi:oxidoreductase [Acidicapsa ligni]|uniref:oxidoreductase n=1 Tax=Acidicapsa ligni TaxID=542300 RepID=UPI0021E0CF90|nr:oxidoreductase [Acidicapsa ligni]